jgi:hypothetical protein
MEVGCQSHSLASLPLKNKGGIHSTEWKGAKNLAFTGIRSRTIQHLASRSTDYAILTHSSCV